jgi:glucuronokinase
MDRFAELTICAKESLLSGDFEILSRCINENFDLRASIMDIDQDNLNMVALARSVGASAKFTGSGGAIIGTYSGEQMFENLYEKMKGQHIAVIKPNIVTNL